MFLSAEGVQQEPCLQQVLAVPDPKRRLQLQLPCYPQQLPQSVLSCNVCMASGCRMRRAQWIILCAAVISLQQQQSWRRRQENQLCVRSSDWFLLLTLPTVLLRHLLWAVLSCAVPF
jgi:hypothetical protein